MSAVVDGEEILIAWGPLTIVVIRITEGAMLPSMELAEINSMAPEVSRDGAVQVGLRRPRSPCGLM